MKRNIPIEGWASVPRGCPRSSVPFASSLLAPLPLPVADAARVAGRLSPIRARPASRSRGDAAQAGPHILLIHGEADTLAPVHVGHELRSAMSGHGSVDLWTVPGADHNQALRAQPDHYARRVTGFLRTALSPE